MNVYAVHTMGRVGSRTVSHSLFGQGFAAVHVHNLNPPNNPYELTTKNIMDSYLWFDTKIWVLSAVRDPVARNLSVYFHTLAERSQKEFLNDYPWDAPRNWIEKELVGYWGAPIFEQEFDKERGWTVYPSTQPRAKVIVYQLEKLDQEWPNIWRHMDGFFEAPLLKRVGESHKPRYDEFKITQEYMDRVYSGKVAQTFYSDDDLERFRHGKS